MSSTSMLQRAPTIHPATLIKVLIVDDSAVVRQVLTALLARDPQISVIAAAADPIIAQEKMLVEWPDVIVLDVEMPRMDGLSFLKLIMAQRPTPVVICSTLTERGAETTLQAMAAGAVCYLTKPKIGLKDFLTDSAAELVRAIKMAAQTRPQNFNGNKDQSGTETRTKPMPGMPAKALAQTTEKVIAIGTSTGGTQALEVILRALPRVSPGIVVVQHMPEKFTALFAERLNSLCAVEVKEAKHSDRVLPGRVLIAPGGKHMKLLRNGAYYHVDVVDGPPINRHKPSVDVLFKSVAQSAGSNALGIIMTGMGDDGARGLLEMHNAGAYSIAQDEASCVVFGMPKEAIALGAVDREITLNNIAGEILRYAH